MEQWLEGRREGIIDLLNVEVEFKFEPAVTTTFAERLEQVQDSDALIRLGVWLLDYDSASEMFDKLDGLSSPGQG